MCVCVQFRLACDTLLPLQQWRHCSYLNPHTSRQLLHTRPDERQLLLGVRLQLDAILKEKIERPGAQLVEARYQLLTAVASVLKGGMGVAVDQTSMQWTGDRGRGVGRERGEGASVMGRELERGDLEVVQEWQQARRRKDFATADRIRTELRTRGIEAEEAVQLLAPPRGGGNGGECHKCGLFGHQARDCPQARRAPVENSGRRTASRSLQNLGGEELVWEWQQARRSRDFDTADNIRAKLREMGIEADEAAAQLGPANTERSKGDAVGVAKYDDDGGPTEDLVAMWQDATRSGDDDIADDIRSQLRGRRVDLSAWLEEHQG